MNMEETKTIDGVWLLWSGFFLLGVLLVYLFLVSNWYWQCRAQIDPITLTPIKCPADNKPTTPSINPMPLNSSKPIEEQIWGDFGSSNSTYDDISGFWGEDLISHFFSDLFHVATNVSRPFVLDVMVPRWNATMYSAFNRKTLFSAISVILGVIAKEWAKDAYQLLRRTRPRRAVSLD